MPAAAPRRFHEPTEGIRLVVGGDRVSLCGDLRGIGRHRHASAAVVVGIDAPLRLVTERTHVARAALLAPGFTHAVDVRGRIAVFLVPTHALSRVRLPMVSDLAPRNWIELGSALLRGELDDFAAVDRALARAAAKARPVDDRLRRAMTELASALDENLAIEALADAAGLSPSRLMALAREQLGTSLRGYRRWLRAFEVARRFAEGASLTEAALAAGFASSAHLSAVARAHFGIRPSQILSPANRAAIRHF